LYSFIVYYAKKVQKTKNQQIPLIVMSQAQHHWFLVIFRNRSSYWTNQ